MESSDTGPAQPRGELSVAGPTVVKRSAGATNGSARGSAPAASRPHAANGEAASPVSPLSVAHALRLRWPWIVLLGAPLGALLAYAAWVYVPTPYTAYAELLCQPRRFFWNTTEDDPRHDVYKQTAMRLIKDPFVLNAALQNSAVKNSRYVLESRDILDTLAKEVRVTGPAQEFIRIELSGPRAGEAAALVNAITEAFVTEVVEKEMKERKKRLDELKDLLKIEETQLQIKQKEQRDMDKRLESPNVFQSNAIRQAQIDSQLALRSQIAQLQPQIFKLQILRNPTSPRDDAAPQDESLPKADVPQVTPEELQAALLADREYAELARQYAHAERMLVEWKRRVREPHPAIERHQANLREAEAKLADRRKELEPYLMQMVRQQRVAAPANPTQPSSREQADSELRMLVALRDRYYSELENLKIQEKQNAVDQVDREILAQDIAKLKVTVDTYSTEVLKRQVELDNAPPPITVRQSATVPTIPDTKMRTMLTAAGGAGGFFLVLAAVVLLEMRARRISELSMVRTHISVPVLGTVPLVPAGARTGGAARQRVAAAYWRNVLSEAFDGIRTVLLHNPRCSGAKVLMIASGSNGEGKSTTCSQLAMSLARTGHRVLLLDGDLRRPTLEREFGLAKKGGFCEVLAGGLALSDAIHPTELTELDLLPAGTLTNQVRSLLARDAHAPVLRDLAERYNFVVIDTSPVLLAADTLLLARHVDGAIVLVHKDVTQLPKLELTLHRFEMIGVPVLGLLAIGLNDASPSYSYGFGYGYGFPPAQAIPSEAAAEAPSRAIAAVAE